MRADTPFRSSDHWTLSQNGQPYMRCRIMCSSLALRVRVQGFRAHPPSQAERMSRAPKGRRSGVPRDDEEADHGSSGAGPDAVAASSSPSSACCRASEPHTTSQSSSISASVIL